MGSRLEPKEELGKWGTPMISGKKKMGGEDRNARKLGLWNATISHQTGA